LFGGANRGAIEREISFSDIAERPVHGFFDEVAVVAGFAADDFEHAQKLFVGRGFVLVGEIGDQRKRCAFYEFFFTAAPLDGFFPRRRSVNEKITAGSVHNIPGIKIARPAFHLRGGNFFGFANHSGQTFRFVNSARPQLIREIVILADRFCQMTKIRHGNSVGFFDVDAEVGHFRADFWVGQRTKVAKDG